MNDSDMYTKPHFLGIGAQKAGTTWLNHCLGASNHIWVPPIKELAFFSSLPERPEAGERAAFTPGFLETFDRLAAQLDADDDVTNWVTSYRRPSMSFEEYVQHFPNGRTCGEITPEYQELSEERVHWIAARLPHLKPIFMMRDPIDRCWSDLRMSVRFGFANFQVGAEPTEQQLYDYLDLEIVATRTDYVATIDRWSAAFGKDAVFCAFNDELEAAPLDLLSRVCSHVSGNPTLTTGMEQRSQLRPNQGQPLPMPAAVEARLAMRWLPMLEELAERFSGAAVNHPERWAERAKSALAGLAQQR